ncbi:unnamed protein product [Blepharisma stoltei]|uniref:Peptidase A1 domain-containing protein n=1 Tax=Blepharisma stoltei TaxID=1481888 RepID=A0AAU9J6R8_9CILI|nr:unnamed protein product [Blepharisma stoltei]
MISLFILLSLTEALIRIPLHLDFKPSANFSNTSYPSPFRRLASSSTVTNYENYQYYVKIEIGTPPQYFSGLLSLRSSWIFIDQKNCYPCRLSSNKFDSSLSLTFQSENIYLTLDSVGQLEGYTGKDTVKIGGIAAKSQRILLVSKEHDMDNLKSDGIFGLGFSTSSDGTPSILNTFYAQHDINHIIFSLYFNDFNDPSDLPNYGQSMLIIGGHDLNKYSAESTFTYIKAKNSNGAWQVDFDSATFDGANYTNAYKAAISSGTSFILGPKDAINGILKRLHDKYDCDDVDGQLYCNCNGKYPDFIVQISGIKFTIKPAGYLIQSDSYCIPTFDYTTIAYAWVLGDSFLRRFYTIFDMENMKIGFATVGYTSQISYSNYTNSNGSGSGSSGTNSTSGSNSTNPGSGSGSSGNGSGSSGNGSGTHNSTTGNTNSTGSGSNTIDSSNEWKLTLAITLSALSVFMVWIFSLAVLFFKMRESRNIAINEQRQEELRRIEELRKIEEERRYREAHAPDHPNNRSNPAPENTKQRRKCGSVFPSELRGLTCYHYFCERDLREYLENSIKENMMEKTMRCPLDHCNGEIGLITIQALVSPNLWEKFDNYYQREL